MLNPSDTTSLEPREYANLILAGGYPEPLSRSPRSTARWFDSYIERLSTHDAADLSQGDFPNVLRSLMRILAARPVAELVNAKIARSLGVSEAAARTYTNLLETMFLLSSTRAWGQGLLGRETRRTKVGLVDTGLAAGIIDFTTEKAFNPGGFEYYGALVEQFVVNELLKQKGWSEQRFNVYHYRSRSVEVDVIVELADGTVVAIEVESSSLVTPASWRHLARLRDELGKRFRYGVVLYIGSTGRHVGDRLAVMPISRLWM